MSSPQLQQAAVSNWADLVNELKKTTAEIVAAGSQVGDLASCKYLLTLQIIPEVDFAELNSGLSAAKAEEIKKRGTVIVRGVVDEAKVGHLPRNRR